MSTEFHIGKRLSFDGQLCTVRYYGEVKATKGEWLGVEWDDATRGKHSGENGGVRYFECASKLPTAGSFVRPTRKADPPRSFVEALKAKYASEDFEDADAKLVHQGKKKEWIQPIRISGKLAEEVGFDKIRKQLANLHELRIVILDGLCMSRPVATLREIYKTAGVDAWPKTLTDVKDACPKTVELDLSRNLFEEWREIASICEQLDKLRSLRVDGNRFRDTTVTDAEKERCLKAFEDIHTLRIEENLLPWKELVDITTLFPSLTTFVASSNSYSFLTDHCITSTITDLTLEDNDFHRLSDVSPLTKLPNLQRLILKSNRVSEISTPGFSHPIFSPSLTDLDLSFNEISTWFFIDALNTTFPGLTSLRISHNPLYASLQAADGRALSAEDGYMLTLARLGNLKSLNHSPITPKERLNAESYYLSLIARELAFSPETQRDQILASHPRYKELCEEYGEPVIKRSENAVNPNSLAARLVRFTFHLANSPEKTFKAEVPMGVTAYTLIGIVVKHFKLAPRRCKLIWETGDWMPAPRAEDAVEEDWDSESSEGEEEGDRKEEEKVMREVEILPGTRAVGTWIDGMEATVRVEELMRKST